MSFIEDVLHVRDSVYSISSMLTATHWGGYYHSCFTGKKTKTWRWLVPDHAASRTDDGDRGQS